MMTVEDPVEYDLSLGGVGLAVSQTQVDPKKGVTFATGLRHMLRQDPDVIMVGEVRDEETAKIAVQASLTGHLVLSTLHTNDASRTRSSAFLILESSRTWSVPRSRRCSHSGWFGRFTERAAASDAWNACRQDTRDALVCLSCLCSMTRFATWCASASVAKIKQSCIRRACGHYAKLVGTSSKEGPPRWSK